MSALQVIVTPDNPATRYIQVFCNGEDISKKALEACLSPFPYVQTMGWAECLMINEHKGRAVCWIGENHLPEIPTYILHGWIWWQPLPLGVVSSQEVAEFALKTPF